LAKASQKAKRKRQKAKVKTSLGFQLSAFSSQLLLFTFQPLGTAIAETGFDFCLLRFDF
jgi:hypothetical protein